MEKKKKFWGWLTIIISVLLYASLREVLSVPQGATSFGIYLGYLIYSKLQLVLMLPAGISLIWTSKNNKKPVFAPVLLLLAVFITFNNFDPSEVDVFMALKLFNIVVAIRLFSLKPDAIDEDKNEEENDY